jgi:hypothetical protein
MLAIRILFPIILISCLSTPSQAEVLVRKSAPTVNYRTFDPDKPPAEMPKLNPAEIAVTVCGFGFTADPHYEIVGRQRGADGTWTAEIVGTGVIVYVRLSVVIWTPKGVTAKLKAHEEGHRKLDEMMYKKLAEPAAKAAGAEMDGHRFTGQGATANKAVTNAVQNMFQQAGQGYMKHTSAVNEEINLTYDAITRHGTNDIPEAEAMKQALERYEHDHPADGAATPTPGEKK